MFYRSALHGAELSGEKLISYWLEDDFKNACNQRLFTKIQNIRSITGARFGDVLLAALSVSLHKYFLRVSGYVFFTCIWIFFANSCFYVNLNFTDERTGSNEIKRRPTDENRGMEREPSVAK